MCIVVIYGFRSKIAIVVGIVASSFTKAMPMTYLRPKMALNQAPWSQVCLVMLLLVIQASCLSFTASCNLAHSFSIPKLLMQILSRESTNILLPFSIASMILLFIDEDFFFTLILPIACCLPDLEITWTDKSEFVKTGCTKHLPLHPGISQFKLDDGVEIR